jgi:hypothetical protein
MREIGIRQRIAARDALAARTRTLTGAVLAVSAALSGLFAGLAAASAPGHKLLTGTSGGRSQNQATTSAGTAIPALPAAPGPGKVAAAPTPAPAPSTTQSPPVAASGSS